MKGPAKQKKVKPNIGVWYNSIKNEKPYKTEAKTENNNNKYKGWVKPGSGTFFTQINMRIKNPTADKDRLLLLHLENNQRLHEEHLNHLCPKPDLGSYFSRQTFRRRESAETYFFHTWQRLKSGRYTCTTSR